VTHHPLFAMPIGKGNELSEAVGQHDDAVKAVCQAGIHIALACSSDRDGHHGCRG
jgi:hypothetical protein